MILYHDFNSRICPIERKNPACSVISSGNARFAEKWLRRTSKYCATRGSGAIGFKVVSLSKSLLVKSARLFVQVHERAVG